MFNRLKQKNKYIQEELEYRIAMNSQLCGLNLPQSYFSSYCIYVSQSGEQCSILAENGVEM